MSSVTFCLQLISCVCCYGALRSFAQEFNLQQQGPTITTHLASSTDRNTGVTRQMYSSLSSFTLSTAPLLNATTTTQRPTPDLPPVFHFNASLFSLNAQSPSSSRRPLVTTVGTTLQTTTTPALPINFDAHSFDENEINVHSAGDNEDALLGTWHMRPTQPAAHDGQHHHRQLQHHQRRADHTTTLPPAVTWTNDEPYNVHNSRHHQHNTSFSASNSPPRIDNYQLDLSMDALGAVAGPIKWVWTRWTPFGSCSTTCGPGLQSHERFCVAQGPQKLLGQDDTFMRCRTGNPTDHDNIRYRACNADDACFDEDTRSFVQDARVPMCAKQNSMTFSGNVRYQWEPLERSTVHGGAPCDLVCKPFNETFYIRFGALPNGFECQAEQLADGQHPSPTLATGVMNAGDRAHRHQRAPRKLNGICVNSTCLEVGCDSVIGSGARRNKCGTCGTADGYEAILSYENDADQQQQHSRQAVNNQCITTRHVFSERNLPTGYNTIASIPAAATSINITELGWSGNSLAIRSDSFGVILDGSKILDDSMVEEEELVITAVGTRFVFRKGRQQAGWQRHQQIYADGPLSEHVDVMLITKNENPGIEYEYSLAATSTDTSINDDAERKHHMLLLRHRDLIAQQQSTKGVVSRPTRMPDSPILRDTGVLHGGEARWILTQWSACSATCGMGTQTREIKCQQEMANGDMQDVPFALCGLNADERQYVRSCQQLQPCHDWRVGAWTKCLPNCGPGQQRRLVKCIDLNSGEFADDHHCLGRRPATERDCTEGTCGAYWYTSAWGLCNPQCPAAGERSVQARKVVCLSASNSSQQVDDNECSALARPIHLRDCPTAPDPLICEPQADWLSGPWSACALPNPTATCGKGIRRRMVVCVRSFVPTNTKGYDPTQATIIDDSQCLRMLALRQKPIEREPCGEDCPLNDPGQQGAAGGEWFASEWDPCSLSCMPVDRVYNDAAVPTTGTQTRRAACLQTFSNINAVSSSSQVIVSRRLNDDACASSGQLRPLTSRTCGDSLPRCPDRAPRQQDEFIDDEAYWNRPVQYEKGITTRTLVSAAAQQQQQQPPPPDVLQENYLQFDSLQQQQQRRRQQVQTPPAGGLSAPQQQGGFYYNPSHTRDAVHHRRRQASSHDHQQQIYPTESLRQSGGHRRREAFDFDVTNMSIDGEEPYANVAALSTFFPYTTTTTTTSTTTTTMSSNNDNERRFAARGNSNDAATSAGGWRRQQSQQHSPLDAAAVVQQQRQQQQSFSSSACKDRLQRCKFVKQIGYCVYEYYRDACCQSCSGVGVQ